MSSFLLNHLIPYLKNDYGEGNIDPYRPDIYKSVKKNKFGFFDRLRARSKLKKVLARKFRHRAASQFLEGSEAPDLSASLDQMSKLYDLYHDERSKQRFLELLAYRLLGYRKVKLWINTEDYWRARQSFIDQGELAPEYQRSNLARFQLTGQSGALHVLGAGYTMFPIYQLGQYHYKNGSVEIAAQSGETVIDCGACTGDTAIYFADRVGEQGKVFSFEFIPSNVALWRESVDPNERLARRIELVERPLWKEDGRPCHYIDRGAGSILSFEDLGASSQVVQTTTIDAVVKEQNLERVDFIKMDIEGSEPSALLGALETLRRFRPKLGISIYHSDWHDFIEIPLFLSSLNLGYQFYLDHFTVHHEETVLFAQAV